MKSFGYNVTSTDLVDRGYPDTIVKDFLTVNKSVDCDIITNPPYNIVNKFVLHALELTGNKVAMFLKIQFLESIGRYETIFKDFPPARVYIFVKRMECYRNGDNVHRGSAVCYAWFVWDKSYTGQPLIYWIPNHKRLN